MIRKVFSVAASLSPTNDNTNMTRSSNSAPCCGPHINRNGLPNPGSRRSHCSLIHRTREKEHLVEGKLGEIYNPTDRLETRTVLNGEVVKAKSAVAITISRDEISKSTLRPSISSESGYKSDDEEQLEKSSFLPGNDKTGSSASSESSRKKQSSGIWHQLYVFWVLIFFAGSSLGAIFINKTCLTGYHFRYPLTMVLGQMLFAIILLAGLHLLGYRNIPIAERRQLTSLAIPTALFTSNVVVGLSALSLVNIPMFSAFRRLTLLFVMFAEYVFLKKTHSRKIMYTVVVMTVGAFISAVDDVTFSRLGYCLVFLNNVLTAGYLAAIKRAMKETSFDPLTLLYYTALMGFPLVATLLVSTGELGHVIVAFRTQPELGTWQFMASLILTATGAFAVNFSTSLCTHVTSPLTTSVAGQVKNVLQTILGFFSWGFVPTTLNIIGLLIALGAQIWFAYLKFAERRDEMKGNNNGGDVGLKVGSVSAGRGWFTGR